MIYKNDKKTKNNIYNLLVVLSYSETLGFFNSKWEFNFGEAPNSIDKLTYITFKIFENYLALGGRNLNIKNFFASDDTILNFATIHSIINDNPHSGFLHYKKDILDEKKVAGNTTIQSLEFISKNLNKNTKYSDNAGGNGAAIRTASIGILFDNIDHIIKQSFLNSIVTHNNAIGFLGGISTALITYFAYNKKSPDVWLEELIKLESKIEKIVKENSDETEFKFYLKDKDKFWNKIKDYNEFKVKIYFNQKRTYEYYDRIEYLLKLFRPNYKNSRNLNIGGGAHEAIIIAYEAILLAFNSKIKNIDFDLLTFYGILHAGDNDSTGAICGAWYAAYQQNIPDNIHPNDLEYINEINKIVDSI